MASAFLVSRVATTQARLVVPMSPLAPLKARAESISRKRMDAISPIQNAIRFDGHKKDQKSSEQIEAWRNLAGEAKHSIGDAMDVA